MRVLSILLAAAVFATPAVAEKPTPEIKITYQADTYRYGDLYRTEEGSTVEACAKLCNTDKDCMSWSLVPPTYASQGRCELKRTPGTSIHQPGVASGIAEYWQMDPGRHGEMRYQPSVPGTQPMPAEQELDGGPAAPLPPKPSVKAKAILAPEPSAERSQDETVQVTPGQRYSGQTTEKVAHLLYGEPVEEADTSKPKTIFKDPSLNSPKPESSEWEPVTRLPEVGS